MPKKQEDEEMTLEEQHQAQIEQIKSDLNNAFPFAALWQDGEVDGGLMKLLPVISVIIEFIMLVLVIILLTKK